MGRAVKITAGVLFSLAILVYGGWQIWSGVAQFTGGGAPGPGADIDDEGQSTYAEESMACLPTDTPTSDGSAGTAELTAAGLPPLEQAWTAASLRQAVDTIERLSQPDWNKLPRWCSQSSGTVFRRLTSTARLERVATSGLSAPEKLRMLLGEVGQLGRFLRLFTSPEENILAHTAEVGIISATVLRILALSMPSLERSRTEQAEGFDFDRIASGLGETVAGSVRIFSDHQNVPARIRRIMIRCLRRDLPVVFPQLTDDSRREIREMLDEITRNETDSEIAGPLSELRGALQ